MNIDYVNFYNNFVKLCKEKGLKPSRAGIEARIPKQTVSNWKAGRKPSDTYIVQLADYFGVPVSYFSEEAPEAEKNPSQMTEAELDRELIEIWKSGDENEHKALLEMARLIKSRRRTK